MIAVKAQKTKNTVWIPIHSAYREWVDRVPVSDSSCFTQDLEQRITEQPMDFGANGKS